MYSPLLENLAISSKSKLTPEDLNSMDFETGIKGLKSCERVTNILIEENKRQS